MSRRALIALGLPLLVTGCGFRAMHARGGRQEDAQVTASLAAVKIGVITERQGQLLRRRLEQSLAPNRRGSVPAKYDLRVGVGYSVEIQGYNISGAASRVRVTATANWFLFEVGPPIREIARGSERALDAYDIPESQFFAADAARETMERQLTDELAQHITERLTMHFRAAVQGAAPA